MRILFLATEDWFFAIHFLPLAQSLVAAGHEVGVAVRVDRHADTIRAAGVAVFPIGLSRGSRNPIRELRAIGEIAKVYRAYRPDIVHHIAVKPILYGTIAGKLARVPGIVNALTGLGYMFTSKDRKARFGRRFISIGYRITLRQGWTIVQNRDDYDLLVRNRVIAAERTSLIYGAGVDTKVFTPTPEPTGDPVIVLPSRMLRDKGVFEFVAAARRLSADGIRARCVLVGTSDPANPASIPESQLQAWADEGVVEWWGWRDDMVEVFRNANIVCLPSYREGLPKSLLEASASMRAVVTTDVPGCREAIIANVSGLLVPVRDDAALALALRRLVRSGYEREEMGRHGRALACERFSIERIAAQTDDAYRALMGDRGRPSRSAA